MNDETRAEGAAEEGAAPPKWVRWNLNEPIKVKLSEWGREVYRRHYIREWERRGAPVEPRVDAEGFSTFPGWEFASIFGPFLGLLKPHVADMDVRIKAPGLTERKGGM